MVKESKPEERHPDSTYNTKYPNSITFTPWRVFAEHWDNTDGAKIRRSAHPSGGYYEIGHDGRHVEATVGNHYDYRKGGKTTTVDHNHDEKHNGGKRKSTTGDAHQEHRGDHYEAHGGVQIKATKGSHAHVVLGEKYEHTSSHHSTRCKGDGNHLCEGSQTIKTKGDSLIQTNGTHTQNTTGNVYQYSQQGDVVHQAVTGKFDFKSKKAMAMNSEDSHSIKAKKDISQETDENHTIKAKQHTVAAETHIQNNTYIAQNLNVTQVVSALSGMFGTGTSTIGDAGVTTSGNLVVNGHSTQNTASFAGLVNALANVVVTGSLFVNGDSTQNTASFAGLVNCNANVNLSGNVAHTKYLHGNTATFDGMVNCGANLNVTGILAVTANVSATGYLSLNVANIINAVDDAAATTAGVPVGGVYRNGSILMIRVA